MNHKRPTPKRSRYWRRVPRKKGAKTPPTAPSPVSSPTSRNPRTTSLYDILTEHDSARDEASTPQARRDRVATRQRTLRVCDRCSDPTCTGVLFKGLPCDGTGQLIDDDRSARADA